MSALNLFVTIDFNHETRLNINDIYKASCKIFKSDVNTDLQYFYYRINISRLMEDYANQSDSENGTKTLMMQSDTKS